MLTTGLNRESGIRTEEMLDCIIDYMGFNTKEIETKVPQLFTTDKENWEDILDESENTIRTVELDTKSNLQATLMDLLEAASITRAANFTKVNPNGDVKLQVKEKLLSSLQLANRMKDILSDDKDWESFQNWIKTQYKNSDIDESPINEFGRD